MKKLKSYLFCSGIFTFSEYKNALEQKSFFAKLSNNINVSNNSPNLCWYIKDDLFVYISGFHTKTASLNSLFGTTSDTFCCECVGVR